MNSRRLVLYFCSSPRFSTADGSARWATVLELGAAGVMDDVGVVLCQTADARFSSKPDRQGGRRWRLTRPGRLVRHAGPEHVLVFAPTRSGKGSGMARSASSPASR